MNKNIKDIFAQELSAEADEDLFHRLVELERTTEPIPIQCESPSKRLAIGGFISTLVEIWDAGIDEATVTFGFLHGFQLGHDYVKRHGPIW